jgi:hypothetical protein
VGGGVAVVGGDACLAGLLLLQDLQLTVLPPNVLEAPQGAAAEAQAGAEAEGEGRCEPWSRDAVHFPLPPSVHAGVGDMGTAAAAAAAGAHGGKSAAAAAAAEADGGGCVVAHGMRVLVARGATLVQRPLLSSAEAEVRSYAPQAAIPCVHI